MSLELDWVFIRPEIVLTNEIKNEDEILFNIHSDQVFAISGTASYIWKLLGQEVSVKQIINQLYHEYPDMPKSQLKEDCLEFLEQLMENGLVKRVK